jgi:acetyl-CoA carboxylase biotin carboxyl carrier protein
MAKPDPKDIESLVELFNQSDWDEMHLKTDELEIFLSNDPQTVGPSQTAAPAPNLVVPPGEEAPPTPVGAPVPDVAAGMVAVSAPNLGTFYRAPKPGAPPYVEVGQRVGEETEVCLIEVMKLFTPVRAGVAGVVREICIDDGQMVEFGQILVVIDPAT